MKKPASKTTPPTKERDQGSIKGSGINKIAKDMPPVSVPQVVAKNRYGRPGQYSKS